MGTTTTDQSLSQDGAAKNAWVARVLGVRFGDTAAPVAAAEQTIARPPEAATGDGAASVPPAVPPSVPPSVPWDKASAAWAAARAAAAAAAKPIVSEMQLVTPGGANGVENVLDSYGIELDGFLKSASGGDPLAGIGQVQSVINALRSEMAGDQLFTYFDSNGIAVRPAFLAGFDQIEGLLRPAANG